MRRPNPVALVVCVHLYLESIKSPPFLLKFVFTMINISALMSGRKKGSGG